MHMLPSFLTVSAFGTELEQGLLNESLEKAGAVGNDQNEQDHVVLLSHFQDHFRAARAFGLGPSNHTSQPIPIFSFISA